MVSALYPVLAPPFRGLVNARYLMTGLGALTVGRDPNGIGGRISEVAAMFRGRRKSHAPTEGSAPALDSLEEVGLAHAGH